MKTTRSLGGIGPKLALMSIPYGFLAFVIIQRDPEFMNLNFLDSTWIRIFGITWLSGGIIFWIASAWVFLQDFKTGPLITGGPFGCCRNPIYASMIIFVIPALGIVFQSGLILSIAFASFLGFRISIHGESILMRRTFRNEYDE